MAAKIKRRKWTPVQVKQQIRRIQEVIEKQRREIKCEQFTAITPEEVEKKLKRVNSPMIVWQGWSPSTPGGTFTYFLGLYNPDPVQATGLYAHVWVGSGNVDPTVGTFLLNVDTRFPRLTEPPFFGLTLAAGASATLTFAVQVPAAAERTNYLGNSCLMQPKFSDIGTYLDRSAFVFRVT